MVLAQLHWLWWVLGAALVLGVLALALALFVWIRMVKWSRSFTAVTAATFPAEPDDLWRVLLEPAEEEAGSGGGGAGGPPDLPAPVMDAFDWLIADDRSDAIPADGTRLVWSILEDQRPDSIVLHYAGEEAGLRGVVELQLEPDGADTNPEQSDEPAPASDAPGADDAPPAAAQPWGATRLVVVHHCDPSWREGAALSRRSEREHAFGDALLRRLAEALGRDEPDGLAYLGAHNVRGPIAP